MKTKFFAVFLCVLFTFSCGSDDDGPVTPDPNEQENPDDPNEPTEVTVLTGIFFDGPVQGLGYQTETQSGTTNASGEFKYVAGETVNFMLGDIMLGSAPGQERITPITLAATVEPGATIENTIAQNIAALLQTLDVDGDETNGIGITEEIITNLGVSNLDFKQPIEAILAEIVLNVVQNTGVEIEVVYPFEAANAMATSLELDYEATPNLAITSLLPTMKVYLENYGQNYIPASAVYKNTFDDQGNLTSIEVLSRYSGKLFFRFTFDSHTMEGLPLTGTAVRFNDNDLFGAFPNRLELENQIAMTYNGEHQLSTYANLFDGQEVNKDQFTAYNEDNQPLSYYRDIGANDPNLEWTITWSFTFENGLIATANRTFDRFNTIDANNSFETITTRDFVHSYDADNNLTQVTYRRVFTDNIVTDGELETYISEATVTDSFTYDGTKKLTDYTQSSDISPSFGDPYTASAVRTYDGDERIKTANYSDTKGFQSTTEFDAGIRTSYVSSRDGLPDSEETYFADGSSERTFYYYFEGELVEIETIEYDADFFIEFVTREFYEAGDVYFSLEEEYNNGILETRTGFDANDDILYVDSFNELGFIVRTEFYFEGAISSIQEFGYDANNYINQVVFKDANEVVLQINNYVLDEFGFIQTLEALAADGTLFYSEIWEYDDNGFLSFITRTHPDGSYNYYYFDEGVLTTAELYDANGNLIQTIDYTGSGKGPRAKALKARAKQDAKANPVLLEFTRDRADHYKKKAPLRKSAKTTDRNKAVIRHLKATNDHSVKDMK